MSRFASTAFVLLLTGAGLAHAETPVTTADPTSAPPVAASDTATQIEDFIRSAPAPQLGDGKPVGVTSSDEVRKVHGEVGVSVGSGGYRSGYVVSVMPVGKTGTLTLAVSDTKSGKSGGFYGGPGYGYGYGGARGFSPQGEMRSVGMSLALGDSANDGCRTRGHGFQSYDLQGRPPIEHSICREPDGDR